MIGEADDADADLVILSEEADDDVPGAARAIRLRATPDAEPGTVGTIYRYDRDSLIAALHTGTGGSRV